MKRIDLYQLHWDLCGEARDIMRNKNADYGGADDPFANFRTHGLYGIIVRMHDKLARLQSYDRAGKLYVKSEGVRDTVHDLINYAVLFEGMVIDADGSGSTGRNDAGQSRPRTVPQEPGAGAGAVGRGVRGSGAESGGSEPDTEAIQVPGGYRGELKVRTSTGGGRGKHVGRKSGRGKGAR